MPPTANEHEAGSESEVFSVALPTADKSNASKGELKKTITFTDGLACVLGSLIGAGMFVSPGMMFERLGAFGSVIAWVAGGALALSGALCYSELATLLVSAGSEATYLAKAFGNVWAFAYALMLFVVVGSGGVAAVASASAIYFVEGIGYDAGTNERLVQCVAIGLVLFCACMNLLGTSNAVLVQRILLVVKVLTIMMVLGCAGIYRAALQTIPRSDVFTVDFFGGFQLQKLVDGMFKVVFAFNGFQYLAPLSEEMVNPDRDVPRVFLAGMTSVTALGLFVIISFVSVLPLDKMSAERLASNFFHQIGGVPLKCVASVMIAFCAAGSANFKLIGCSRIFFSAARDGIFPKQFAYVSERNVPTVSIIATSVWTICILMVVSKLNDVLKYFLIGQLLVFAAVGLALIRLRSTMPFAHRPYRVSLYPSTPVVFSGSCIFMVVYALFDPSTAKISWCSLLLTFMGFPVWYLVKHSSTIVSVTSKVSTNIASSMSNVLNRSGR